MNRYATWLVLMLIPAVVASGVWVVYAQYSSRHNFSELQQLRSERQVLEVRWGQLRLEEAALTTHPRVEETARTRLGMHLPHRGDVRVLDGELHGR